MEGRLLCRPSIHGFIYSNDSLFLFAAIGCLSCLGLLFNQQGHMLFTEAERPPTRQQLRVRRRLAAIIAAPNMGLHSLHGLRAPPQFQLTLIISQIITSFPKTVCVILLPAPVE